MIFSVTIKRLHEAGLSAEQIVIVTEEIERAVQRNATVMQRTATETGAFSVAAIERRASTNTERSRIYREKRRNEHATNMQRNETPTVASPLHGSPSPLPISILTSLEKEVVKKEDLESARETKALEIVETWNRFADYANASGRCAKGCKIAAIAKLTTSRRTAINARLKEYTIEQFKAALNLVSKSEGCLGHNDRKWKANIDWLLRPNTIATIFEGKYEHWKQSGHAPKPEHPATIAANKLRAELGLDSDSETFGFDK